MTALPDRGRLLGVDLGEVRIGLAVSDPDQTVATPAETLPVQAPADLPRIARDLLTAARRLEAVGVVVGLPRTLQGREEEPARRARGVARELERELPVELWDERFSTAEADRAMRAGGADGRERRGAVDRVAASLILRGYLQARRAPAGGEGP